jgi:hypothetical protein
VIGGFMGKWMTSGAAETLGICPFKSKICMKGLTEVNVTAIVVDG